MNRKELRKLRKDSRIFTKELKALMGEKEKFLKLCARPFSRTEAMSVYKEITAGDNQRLYEKRYAQNLCKQVVSYASGNYTVYSVYDTILKQYTTQITYGHGRYTNRIIRNKRIQQLLHEYGEMMDHKLAANKQVIK